MYYKFADVIIATNSMRIAVFHEVSKGGARRAINAYAKELKDSSRIDLYTTEKIADKEKNFFTNVFYYPLQLKKWEGHNWKIRLYKDTFELFTIARLHKRIAHDINNGSYDTSFINPSRHMQSPFILNYLKIPSVFYLHDPHYRILYEKDLSISKHIGLGKYYYENLNRNFRKLIDKRNIVKASLILANSKFTKHVAEKSYGISSKVCYYGVDSVFLKQTVNKRDIDILYIGSRQPVDDYDLMKESMKYLKKTAVLKSVLTDEKWYSDIELRRLYQRSKIVVCCTRNEPFGLVPLESMASGAVVVAVNEGGYKESVVHYQTGILIPRNPKQLAKAITILLRDKELWKKLSSEARDRIKEQWTWDIAGRNIKKYLDNSISR